MDAAANDPLTSFASSRCESDGVMFLVRNRIGAKRSVFVAGIGSRKIGRMNVDDECKRENPLQQALESIIEKRLALNRRLRLNSSGN